MQSALEHRGHPADVFGEDLGHDPGIFVFIVIRGVLDGGTYDPEQKTVHPPGFFRLEFPAERNGQERVIDQFGREILADIVLIVVQIPAAQEQTLV